MKGWTGRQKGLLCKVRNPGVLMPMQPDRSWKMLVSYGWILVAIAVVTAIGKAMEPAFDLIDIVLLYLLPVLVSAVRLGLWPSLAASVVGILAFDFFFVPPVLSFAVRDMRHVVSFAVFLLVALVTGTLAARLRSQVRTSRERERRTAALYALSDKMGAAMDIQTVLQTVVSSVSQSIVGDVVVFLPGDRGNHLGLLAWSGPECFALTEKERDLAQWTFDLREKADSPIDGGRHFFVPVCNNEACLAVLVLELHRSLTGEEEKDLEALTNLTALAITRVHLAGEAEQVKWLAESEKLHRALLNAVSHDLRTPLASITGAVTDLLLEDQRYDEQTRDALLNTIKEGALRMNRFVTNLLDMARLESGILKLNREWHDMVDIIGVALRETREILPAERVRVVIPDDLPLVHVDFGLIEQVMINLLENSAKYSPPESMVTISFSTGDEYLRVEVADHGPPVPMDDREAIFDKFYRLKSSRHVTGTGLGLSICRGIVEAHGGTIWVEPGQIAGNRFVVALPASRAVRPSFPVEPEERHVD